MILKVKFELWLVSRHSRVAGKKASGFEALTFFALIFIKAVFEQKFVFSMLVLFDFVFYQIFFFIRVLKSLPMQFNVYALICL